MKVDENAKNILNRLYSPDLDEYEATLPQPVPGTLDWYKDCINYKNLIEPKDKSGLLLISGYPGQGKTTLISHILRENRQSQKGNTVVCGVYCSRLVTALGHCASLLSNLLYQLMQHNQVAVDVLTSSCANQPRERLRTVLFMKTVLERIILTAKNTHFYFIIDSVDECADFTQNNLHSLFRAMLEPAEARVKLIFTSRPNQSVLSGLEYPGKTFRCTLDDHNDLINTDVEKLVEYRLRDIFPWLEGSPVLEQELASKIIVKAGSTFLWVNLVLGLLEKRKTIGEDELERLLTQLPPGLGGVYKELILNIADPGERRRAAKLLHIVFACGQPLSITQLVILEHLDRRIVSLAQLDRIPATNDELKQLESLLVPLVRTTDSRFLPYHLSLLDYLLELAPESDIGEFAYDSAQAELYVATVCIRYLLFNEFSGDTSDYAKYTTDSPLLPFPARQLQKRQGRYAKRPSFFYFAANKWLELFKSNSLDATDEQISLALQLCSDPGRVSVWLGSCGYDWPGDKKPLPLQISAYHGLLPLLHSVLESGDEIEYGSLKESLCGAASQGQLDCLESILDTERIHEDDVTEAFVLATKGGHLDCMKLINMKRESEPGKLHRNSRALSSALGLGQLASITYLLEQNLIDINAFGTFTVAGGCGIAALKLLLEDKRLDVTKGEPLVRAARVPSSEAIKMLLAAGVSLRSNEMLVSALHNAIENKCTESIRLLALAKPEIVALRNKYGMNAIAYAARSSTPKVLKCLIDINPSAMNALQKNGASVLYRVLESRDAYVAGWNEKMRMLLDRAPHLVNVTWEDSTEDIDLVGPSILIRAFKRSALDIASMLIDTPGIDLLVQDYRGRTAGWYAVFHEDPHIISKFPTPLLLNHGMEAMFELRRQEDQFLSDLGGSRDTATTFE